MIDLATLTQGKSHQYCVYATGGPLRITLAWYDYPADTNAASVLVNNLDLQVGRRDRGRGTGISERWGGAGIAETGSAGKVRNTGDVWERKRAQVSDS